MLTSATAASKVDCIPWWTGHKQTRRPVGPAQLYRWPASSQQWGRLGGGHGVEIHDALFNVGALIVAAKLLEGIFKRFGLNSIFAYAIAGVILGPATGLVETGRELDLILSIGIFMFFFLIGLEELDISGFIAAIRGRLFIASVLSVTLSTLVSLTVTTDVFFDLGLGLNFTQALGLAGVLSLSSLGVVAKALVDEGRLREPVGVQIFTAVIIAELIALFVVGFAISEHFSTGEQAAAPSILSVLRLIGEILGFAIVTWFVSNKLVPRLLQLLHRLLRVPQFAFRMLLGGLFLVVVAAEKVGLHGSLGALLFGAALSLLPYQMRRDIHARHARRCRGVLRSPVLRVGGVILQLGLLEACPWRPS